MKQYLTTPIYYASGSPHLGHAYTTFVADCYKRYYKLRGDQVKLLSGTDEHGQKIERNADQCGEPVELFVERRSAEFRDLWKHLDIGLDAFERTSGKAHKELVVNLWRRLKENGDIYKSHYEGLYCVDCEQYFTTGDECPVHRKLLENFSEESYFFRLSRYQDKLIHHIEANPGFIVPASRRNEVLSFLSNNELHDLSVSRTSTRWGIEVPEDSEHVIYVWLDALAAYLSGLGSLHSDEFDHYWCNTTHFIGKDILLFHAVYWPAFLWSAGLELPRRLVVNGWLTVEGRKISKSDPDTIVDPLSLMESLMGSLTDSITNDGLKFYFLKSVTLGQDLDFQRCNLVDLLNADLANNVGNLFSRFIKLFTRKFPDGITQDPSRVGSANNELRLVIGKQAETFELAIEAFDTAKAARTFIDTAGLINASFQQREPWNIKDERGLAGYLWTVHHCLADLTLLGASFVPELTAKARIGLNLSQETNWGDLGCSSPGVSVRRIDALFPRI